MKPASEHIKQMLLADTNIDTVNYPPYIGLEPEKPNKAIILFDYGNIPRTMLNTSEELDFPSVQVRVRATDYIEGWNLIESVKKSLHGRANEQWNGMFYISVMCLNGPFFLEWDKRQRVIFVINIDTQRKECII